MCPVHLGLDFEVTWHERRVNLIRGCRLRSLVLFCLKDALLVQSWLLFGLLNEGKAN